MALGLVVTEAVVPVLVVMDVTLVLLAGLDLLTLPAQRAFGVERE